MKRAHTLLLTSALILGGLAPQARAGEAAPISIDGIHKALRKASGAPLLIGMLRYSLVNARYEDCTSRSTARCEGVFIKRVTPTPKGWSVEILTLDGRLLMKGTCQDGKGNVLDGHCTYYDHNSTSRAHGRYAHGVKTGTWERFDVHGQPLPDKLYFGENWDAMQVRIGLATLSGNHDGERFLTKDRP